MLDELLEQVDSDAAGSENFRLGGGFRWGDARSRLFAGLWVLPGGGFCLRGELDAQQLQGAGLQRGGFAEAREGRAVVDGQGVACQCGEV